MTASGAVHVLAAVLALVTAGVVLSRPKGTRSHVRLGRLYVVLLLTLNTSALLTYDDTGRPGGFHVLALVSLATLFAGLLLSPRRATSRIPHAVLMVWSVTGLVAAGLAQAATVLLPQAAPWPTLLTSCLACAVAAVATSAMATRASSLPATEVRDSGASV